MLEKNAKTDTFLHVELLLELNADPSTLGFLLICPDRKALDGRLNCIVSLKPGPALHLKVRRNSDSTSSHGELVCDSESAIHTERRTEREERRRTGSSSSSRSYHVEMERENENMSSNAFSEEEDDMHDRSSRGELGRCERGRSDQYCQYIHPGEDGYGSTAEHPAPCKRGPNCWFYSQGNCKYYHDKDQAHGRPPPGITRAF